MAKKRANGEGSVYKNKKTSFIPIKSIKLVTIFIKTIFSS